MNNLKPLIALLITALIGFLFVGMAGFHTLKESLIESEKRYASTMLNIARNQSLSYIAQYQQGKLTKQQTDEKIIQFLSTLRHEAAYIWANDDNGIARVHVRKEIIGQFQPSYVNHMANLANQDIFYLAKTNIKPITNQRVLKINSITKLPEWNWVIGFGIYMDDINKVVINSAVTFIISGMVSILLFVSFAFYWIRKANGE